MTVYNWDQIWMVNTAISVVLLVVFFALFRAKLPAEEAETGEAA